MGLRKKVYNFNKFIEKYVWNNTFDGVPRHNEKEFTLGMTLLNVFVGIPMFLVSPFFELCIKIYDYFRVSEEDSKSN